MDFDQSEPLLCARLALRNRLGRSFSHKRPTYLFFFKHAITRCEKSVPTSLQTLQEKNKVEEGPIIMPSLAVTGPLLYENPL